MYCESAVYPDFYFPNGPPAPGTPSSCHCLGDAGLTAAQSNAILDKVCRNNSAFAYYDNKVVPFKQRCGVTDLTAINVANMCTCKENQNSGVGTKHA
jgi:hypothetical protein